MDFIMEVLDSSKSRTAFLTGVTGGKIRERVNSVAELEVVTVEKTSLEHLVPGNSFIRVREKGASLHSTFRVGSVETERKGERIAYRVHARHIIGDTMKEIYDSSAVCLNLTPPELAELVLGKSVFVPGIIEPEAIVPYVRFEYETVWDCLLKICKLTCGELRCDEDEGSIGIGLPVQGEAEMWIAYGLGLNRVSRKTDTSNMANRVWCIGGGQPPLTFKELEPQGRGYVEDAGSISRWGLHGEVIQEPGVEKVMNLVPYSCMNGVYNGGLCEGWEKEEGTVTEECTDPAYTLYGGVSQKVITDSHGQGIKRTVEIGAGKIYSLTVNLFVSGGNVRVKVMDSNAVYSRPGPVTGTGFFSVSVENWKTIGDSVTIGIFQEGAEGALWHVDSVQVTEGARAKQFHETRSDILLYEKAVQRLESGRHPEISYEIDLGPWGAGAFPEGKLRPITGQTIRVSDANLGIDVTTRVVEREVGLGGACETMVRLDTPSRRLADTLEALKKSTEQAMSHTRAILASNSQAFETSSSENSLGNRSFRFTGVISPTGGCGASWTEGLFRTANAVYSIPQGGSYDLEEESIFYFYFDRTSPYGFIHSADADDADNEDRVLVFAFQTSTASGTGTVHPFGIVKS